MSAGDFLVAPSNEAAVAWIDAWPNWPAPALVIHGAAGCGKSHLAQVWRVRSGAALAAPADLDPATVPELVGHSRAIVIERAHEVAGVPAQERALLHLYNIMAETSGHLLLTAAYGPAHWLLKLADLRSRLCAAPAAAVEAPDDALLAAIIVKLFADRQVRVPIEVVDFLITRTERSVDAVRVLVAELDAAALAAKRRITVPFVRDLLARRAVVSDPDPGRA